MKNVLFILSIISSLFAFNDSELFNQLPTNWDKEQREKIVNYYKEYGKNYNNIMDYANEVKKIYETNINKNEQSFSNENITRYYGIFNKNKIIEKYINYINQQSLVLKEPLNFVEYIKTNKTFLNNCVKKIQKLDATFFKISVSEIEKMLNDNNLKIVNVRYDRFKDFELQDLNTGFSETFQLNNIEPIIHLIK